MSQALSAALDQSLVSNLNETTAMFNDIESSSLANGDDGADYERLLVECYEEQRKCFFLQLLLEYSKEQWTNEEYVRETEQKNARLIDDISTQDASIIEQYEHLNKVCPDIPFNSRADVLRKYRAANMMLERTQAAHAVMDDFQQCCRRQGLLPAVTTPEELDAAADAAQKELARLDVQAANMDKSTRHLELEKVRQLREHTNALQQAHRTDVEQRTARRAGDRSLALLAADRMAALSCALKKCSDVVEWRLVNRSSDDGSLMNETRQSAASSFSGEDVDVTWRALVIDGVKQRPLQARIRLGYASTDECPTGMPLCAVRLTPMSGIDLSELDEYAQSLLMMPCAPALRLLHARFQRELPLMEELGRLRVTHAIDWRSAERTLIHLMDNGRTVDIRIGEDYPRKRHQLELRAITGCSVERVQQLHEGTHRNAIDIADLLAKVQTAIDEQALADH